jgi:hypothetical protein
MDDPCCFVKQAGTTAGQPGPLPRHAQVLARETESHHVARREVVRPSGADIIQRDGIRPLCGQQFSAVGITLHMAGDAESGMAEAEIEAADSCEKRNHRRLNKRLHATVPPLRCGPEHDPSGWTDEGLDCGCPSRLQLQLLVVGLDFSKNPLGLPCRFFDALGKRNRILSALLRFPACLRDRRQNRRHPIVEFFVFLIDAADRFLKAHNCHADRTDLFFS